MRQVRPNPIKVVFRQAPNLRQRLVKSNLRELPFNNQEDVEEVEAGCVKFPHGRMGRPCVTCPRINVSTTFTSSRTKMRYRMRHRLWCKSRYVIYLVTCTKPCGQGSTHTLNGVNICGRQYTGKTTESMAGRHASHRTEVKNRSTPLGRHFADCGIENFSLQIIDTVREGEDDALSILEGFWTHRLATFKIHGNLNVVNEMTRN